MTVTPRQYRLIYAGLTALLLTVVAVAVTFGSPEGEDIGLPEQIEAISPVPNETVLRQARIEVDMQIGYAIEIWVDGFRIPDNEIIFVEATGVYSWGPGLGRAFIEWSRGEHTVMVKWMSVVGLPDIGEYEWSFRVF